MKIERDNSQITFKSVKTDDLREVRSRLADALAMSRTLRDNMAAIDSAVAAVSLEGPRHNLGDVRRSLAEGAALLDTILGDTTGFDEQVEVLLDLRQPRDVPLDVREAYREAAAALGRYGDVARATERPEAVGNDLEAFQDILLPAQNYADRIDDDEGEEGGP